MMSKLGGHRQITAFLNRFLGPSSSSSGINGSCFLRKMICCPKYGSTSEPKHGAFLWMFLPAQAALVFGGSCSFVFAQDTSTAVPNDVGLQPVQDRSIISNEHTSKWRIFTDNGREYFMKGKLSEAEKLFSSALAEAKKGFGEQDPHVASACNNLAELYRVQKLYDKAEPLYLDAISILEAAFGPEDVRVGAALHNLGQFYIAQRKFEESRVCYERSLKIKGRILGHGHADYAETMFHLGTVLYLQGNVEDAEALIQDSIRILEEGGQGESFSCIRKMRYLAKIYAKSNNQLEEAENVQRKILHIMELTKGWDSLDTVIAAESLSVTLQSLGKLRDAGELLERCLNARRTLLPTDHIQIGANLLGLANLSLLNFEKMKKIGDSEALLELGRAEKLLRNAARISHLVLDKTKGKKNTWNNGKHIGRDHQTALIILLMSLKALAQVELSRLGEQNTPEALLEAEKLLRDCIRSFGEYGAITYTSMSIEVKRDYVCTLKNLLNLIIDSTAKDAEQSWKAEIQKLKNEIRLIEENISLNKQ